MGAPPSRPCKLHKLVLCQLSDPGLPVDLPGTTQCCCPSAGLWNSPPATEGSHNCQHRCDMHRQHDVPNSCSTFIIPVTWLFSGVPGQLVFSETMSYNVRTSLPTLMLPCTDRPELQQVVKYWSFEQQGGLSTAPDVLSPEAMVSANCNTQSCRMQDCRCHAIRTTSTRP